MNRLEMTSPCVSSRRPRNQESNWTTGPIAPSGSTANAPKLAAGGVHQAHLDGTSVAQTASPPHRGMAVRSYPNRSAARLLPVCHPEGCQPALPACGATKWWSRQDPLVRSQSEAPASGASVRRAGTGPKTEPLTPKSAEPKILTQPLGAGGPAPCGTGRSSVAASRGRLAPLLEHRFQESPFFGQHRMICRTRGVGSCLLPLPPCC